MQMLAQYATQVSLSRLMNTAVAPAMHASPLLLLVDLLPQRALRVADPPPQVPELLLQVLVLRLQMRRRQCKLSAKRAMIMWM